MGDKFTNLSFDRSKGLHKIVFTNSKLIYKDAITIVKNNNSYSRGTSLLILSLEECIKAVYILLHSERIEVYKLRNSKKIFTNHKERHNIAQSVEVIISFFEVINKYSEYKNTKIKKRSDGIRAFLEIFISIIDSSERYEKLQNLNDLKNKGLYVDYIDLVLIPENEICEKDYLKVNEICKRIFKVYRILTLFSNEKYLIRSGIKNISELKSKVIGTINENLKEYNQK